MKKILFINSQPITPPISGLRKKIFFISNYLKKYFQVEYFNFSEYKLKKLQIFKNMLSSLFNSPFEVVIYQNKTTFRKLTQILKKFDPDYIFVDYIRIAHIYPFIKNKRKIILNMDDPQSLKYKKMKKMVKEIENPFGEAINILPEFLQKIVKLNLIKKILLSYEAKMMQKYERKWSKCYKIVLTNSINDKKYLEKIGIKNVQLLPPMIEVKKDLKIEKKENYILFVGKMDYAPNPDAVFYFIKKIFPIIRNKKPEIEFWIIGANIRDEQKNSWEKERNIKVIGKVPELEPYYKKAIAFVSPLRIGTGIKVKILEAMQYGAPVITTPTGAEGIGAINGKHLLIAKNERDFALKVITVIENQELREKLILNAFEFVKQKYNVCKLAEKLVKLYSEI